MFTKQDSEYQQQLNNRFYNLQQEFIKENNLQSRKNDYLNNEFFQHIVINYQKDRSEYNGWLFGKALDILIRNNIASKQFIQYNEETKQDFYSNAMYRCNKFTINSFKPEQSAFVYFTSTVKNAFKEELNSTKKQKSIAKKKHKTNGLDGIMYNVDNKSKEDLRQEYTDPENIREQQNKVSVFNPLFIDEVKKRYSSYKIYDISLPEEKGLSRFQMKYHKYDTFIEVSASKVTTISKKGNTVTKNVPIGLVIEYIDLIKMNENKGMYKNYLQKRALVARKNGHQCFFLFSDIWNDKDLQDSLIFSRIDEILSCIKENVNYNTGKDLMLDYIPYSLITNLGVTEPSWWLLDTELKDRHLVLDQSPEEYIKMKDLDKDCTRTFDAGYLKIK